MNEKWRNEFNVYNTRRRTIIRGAGGKELRQQKQQHARTAKTLAPANTSTNKFTKTSEHVFTYLGVSTWGKHVYTPPTKPIFEWGHDNKTAFFRTHTQCEFGNALHGICKANSDRFSAGLGALCGWKSLCGTAAPWSLLPERGHGK